MDTTHHIITVFPFNVEGCFKVNFVSDLAACNRFSAYRRIWPHRTVRLETVQQRHHSAPYWRCRKVHAEGSHKSSLHEKLPFQPVDHSDTLERWLCSTSSDVCYHWHAPAMAEWVSLEWGDVWYRSRIPWCPVSVMCLSRMCSMRKQ